MSDKISAVWALCEILLFASTKSRQICARFLIPITTTNLLDSNATSQNPKHTSKIPNTSRVSKYTNIQIQLPKIHQECPNIQISLIASLFSCSQMSFTLNLHCPIISILSAPVRSWYVWNNPPQKSLFTERLIFIWLQFISTRYQQLQPFCGFQPVSEQQCWDRSGQ